VVVEHPDKVDVSRLDLSLAYYDQTLALSPNNAKNWNEAASVAYIKGDTQRALADLDASLKLDKQFVETYLRQGDILADSGDPQGAAKAYKNAAELRPEDSQLQQVVGVYSGQAGDVQGALDAFKKAIELEMSALNSTEAQLADLDAQVAKIGGYDKAGAAAGQRRKQLQDAITSNHSQLQLAYRNEALVLRDTGRTAEALAAARAALNYATPDEKTQLDQLVAELQK
jgi:tetratricopeptide (TPR) repeat protein